MGNQQTIDMTERAVLGEQFPLRLMQLGFRLMQVIDATGRALFRYVVPPSCEVPAGPLHLGKYARDEELSDDDEPAEADITVPAFRITIYPVTVAEYGCAVQAGAVDEPQARMVAASPASRSLTWQGQLRRLDRPVVCVTWHQARAYAQWFAQITQLPWRLPTEMEWERASQGTNGRSFPWGNHLPPTSMEQCDRSLMMPVGSYPQEASHCGAQDMVGLMYEWTSTNDHAYLQEDYDPAHYIALRCGWWGYNREYVRNAFIRAMGLLPETWSYDIGMRLALHAEGGIS